MLSFFGSLTTKFNHWAANPVVKKDTNELAKTLMAAAVIMSMACIMSLHDHGQLDKYENAIINFFSTGSLFEGLENQENNEQEYVTDHTGRILNVYFDNCYFILKYSPIIFLASYMFNSAVQAAELPPKYTGIHIV